MELKQGYKTTEVGLIPEDWEVKSQNEIVKYINGRAYGLHEWEKSGVPVVRLQNLTNKGGNFYYSNLNLPDYQYMNKGDLIFMWSASFGPYIWWGDKAIFHYHIWKIECKNNKADKDFYYFKLLEITEELKKGTSGSTMLHLTKGFMENYLVSVPPLPEQKAIAQVLSDTDSLIQAIEQKLTKKRAIKQGAMQQLLTPKEDWEVNSFPEVCWFQEGPGVRKHQFTKKGVKLLNGTNIEKGQLLLEKTDKYVSYSEANGWYSHFLVDTEDILIACSGITINKFEEKVTIAKSNHLPLCMNTSTMRFKVKNKKLDKGYLFHFLKSDSFKSQIGGKATGSAQLNFGPSHVSKVNISLPILNEQIEIASILSDMDAEIEQLEQKLSKYKMVKQGLMQNLLTGKIRLV